MNKKTPYDIIKSRYVTEKSRVLEELKEKNKPKHIMRKILEQREDAWVVKLRTLHPDGFNKELNDPTTPY